MTNALYEGNDELVIEIKEHMYERLQHLLRIEADLVYYGHFTRADVASMLPLERIFHIQEINRRIEAKNKALQGK